MFDKPMIHTLVGGIDGKTQLDLPKMWNIVPEQISLDCIARWRVFFT
jgi:hypothetical protein